MNSILKRPLVVGALIGGAGLIVLVLVLSLLHGSSPAAASTTTSSSTNAGNANASHSSASVAVKWHNLAQCFRSHGYSIADPTVNADGTSSWSDNAGGPPSVLKNAMRAVGDQTCQPELNALPEQLVSPPPTAAELHQLVLFAGCMREHGISDWPDPHADGAFPLNARLLALGKRGIVTQLLACRHIIPGSGLRIDGPHDAAKPTGAGG